MLVQEYPQVLISTAAWSNWVEFMSLFLKEVKVDEELRTKISKPLRMNFQGDNDTEDEFADVMNDLENLQAS